MNLKNIPNTLPSYLLPVAELLESTSVGSISPPWRLIASLAVGGLQAVGFERETENLLVVSTMGQSLIDCTTGEKFYRNYDDDGYDWSSLRAQPLNAPNSNWIPMCGLHGGAMRFVTDDRWSVIQIPLHWPQYYFILEHPGHSIFDVQRGREPRFDLLANDYEARAYGFSWTGRTLIWADGGNLDIWGR